MSLSLIVRPAAAFFVAAIVVFGATGGRAAPSGLTPHSPEVEKAVAKAVKFLESDAGNSDRVGGKALVGLALLKYGVADNHPRVEDAVKAIQAAVRNRNVADIGLDIYSAGLSVIYLVTLDPAKYEPEIVTLLAYLQAVQKPHGGWGYRDKPTGDTSMTQYAVLCSWEAAQAGFRMPRESIEAVTTWLLRTQDPSGGFGYQGIVSETSGLVKQSGVRHSMVAAGLGSVYICANLLGLSDKIERDESLPRVLREVRREAGGAGVKTTISQRSVREAQSLGNSWIGGHYKIDPPTWTHYYLYALERYWSFREAAEGERSGRWYAEGARYLIRSQNADGSWTGQAQGPHDTAFATLFLLRSSKKSIEHAHYYRAGMLRGGRGLPRDAARLEVRGGTIVARPPVKSAPRLLEALRDAEHPEHREAVTTLHGLPPGEAQALLAGHAAPLRALAETGPPEVRAGILQALAATRNLDYAPTLIAALGDPDPAVVRQAVRALEQLGRKNTFSSVPDALSEADREGLIARWKAWYASVRPDAAL